jgi:antitoxin ParD1/3/4
MTLNVSLTPHLEEFVRQRVSTGRYQSASEVIRTALRLLEERERQKDATLKWLTREIQKGLDSGPATPLDMEEVKRRGRQRLGTDAFTPQHGF